MLYWVCALVFVHVRAHNFGYTMMSMFFFFFFKTLCARLRRQKTSQHSRRYGPDTLEVEYSKPSWKCARVTLNIDHKRHVPLRDPALTATWALMRYEKHCASNPADWLQSKTRGRRGRGYMFIHDLLPQICMSPLTVLSAVEKTIGNEHKCLEKFPHQKRSCRFVYIV